MEDMNYGKKAARECVCAKERKDEQMSKEQGKMNRISNVEYRTRNVEGLIVS
jgi:hypothetical protein